MKRVIVLAGAAATLGLVASPSSAEVMPIGNDGFVSRNAVEVRVSAAEAWPVLVAPGRWWNKAHTYSGDPANLSLEARAGGCFCESVPPAPGGIAGARTGAVEHMRVVLVQPGQALRLIGALGPLQSEPVAAVLTVTLKAVPGGTRIVWEYVVGGTMRYKLDEIGPAVDKVMAEQLHRLATTLGPLAPPSPGTAPPAHGRKRTAPAPPQGR